MFLCMIIFMLSVFLNCSGSREVTPVTESHSVLNIGSRSTTPQSSAKTTPTTGRRSLPNSEPKVTRQLVDISGGDDDDDDDVATTRFGQLRVGFTPGMKGRSRRVCVTFHASFSLLLSSTILQDFLTLSQ